MVIPQLDARLEKDLTELVALMYENLTEDNEDCECSGLLYVLC